MNNLIEASTQNTTICRRAVENLDYSSMAWKIFTTFLEDGQLNVSEDELMEFAVKELYLDISRQPAASLEFLPTILIFYFNVWPEWQHKHEWPFQFTKEYYFHKFRRFLIAKMDLLKDGEILKCAMQESEAVAPSCAIKIMCPPSLMNNLMFINDGDEIIMKEHLGNQWIDLSTIQLVNWPHIEVKFYTPDLSFIRRQATEFERYLTFSPYRVKNNNNSPVIDNAQCLRANDRPTLCYSYRLLDEYIKEYISALKTITDITGGKLEEILTILTQFLEDVKHINVNNSMATNIAVLFKLSLVPFFRYKKSFPKFNGQVEDRVGFCEIIHPKIELAMLHFKPKQKETPYASFDLPERIKKADPSLKTVLPYIIYKCTFCSVEYGTLNAKALMLDHLKKQHKMELHVRCSLCQEQLSVLNLSILRWKHTCASTVSSSQSLRK